MTEYVRYGPGGWDPDAPDENVVERFEIEDPEPTDSDRLAALEAQNAALVAALAKATTLAQVRAAAQAAAG